MRCPILPGGGCRRASPRRSPASSCATAPSARCDVEHWQGDPRLARHPDAVTDPDSLDLARALPRPPGSPRHCSVPATAASSPAPPPAPPWRYSAATTGRTRSSRPPVRHPSGPGCSPRWASTPRAGPRSRTSRHHRRVPSGRRGLPRRADGLWPDAETAFGLIDGVSARRPIGYSWQKVWGAPTTATTTPSMSTDNNDVSSVKATIADSAGRMVTGSSAAVTRPAEAGSAGYM